MHPIKNVKKRNGQTARFDSMKISSAIWKAAQSVGGQDKTLAKRITTQVKTVLEVLFKDPKSPPSVEQIQDLVEKILIEGGHAKTAKAYILYRAERSKQRAYQETIFGKSGSNEMLNFSPKAINLLQDKFLNQDNNGKFIETPAKLVKRIAQAIATADSAHNENTQETETKFYQVIKNLEFLPNPAILRNAGIQSHQLADDFVIPIEDSVNGIFTALKHAALIYKNGGAVGINFSNLRPSTDIVQGKEGISSGPVSFIELFNTAIKVIKQGVPELPINMISIKIDHPNILEFINLADKSSAHSQSKLTISITDRFIEALEKNIEYELINPRDKSIVKSIPARMVFDNLITSTWKNNSPQITFIDQIGENKTITPSGQLLLPYETCHGGAINIAKHITEENTINWEKLTKTVETAIHFLDNTIDAHLYAIPQIEEITKKSRKIELNLIGIEKTLKVLEIKQNSTEAIYLMEKIAEHIQNAAEHKSKELAENRGSLLENSKLRHTTLTTFTENKDLEILAGIEQSEKHKSPINTQISFFKLLQTHFDGAIIPKLHLDSDSSISDVKNAYLEAHHQGCHGLIIKRQEETIQTHSEKTTTTTERKPAGLSGVQEIIPPPMIEMSKIVKETLQND